MFPQLKKPSWKSYYFQTKQIKQTQQHIKLRYDSNLENLLGRYCEEEVFLGIHWKTTLADGIDVRDCASDLAGNFLFFSRPILIATYK